MIYDLHNDFLTGCGIDGRAAVLESYRSGGLTNVILAIWTTRLGKTALMSVNALPRTDIVCRFAIEDLGSLGTVCHAKIFDVIRPAYVSLTWNGENSLAGGCGCEAPVTGAGLRAIDEMAERSIALDLSHLSDTSFYCAADYAGKRGCRILCSHTAARGISAHPRNITDDMAKLVARAGGIVGIAAVPNFLNASLHMGENCGRDAYADHIAYMCDIIGPEHVAVGTDFFGSEYYPEGLENYDDMNAIARSLKLRGFGDDDINAVFYGNAKKFFSYQE